MHLWKFGKIPSEVIWGYSVFLWRNFFFNYRFNLFNRYACCCVISVMSNPVRPHRRQPTRLPRPWDSPGRNTGVGCHFLLQCMKVKSQSEDTQSCPTLCDPMDCSPPGSSVHGIFQARVLEWSATAFSLIVMRISKYLFLFCPFSKYVSLGICLFNLHFWMN